ncbi:MAG: chemotaxis protein CheA, partial [Brevinematia bacterium]
MDIGELEKVFVDEAVDMVQIYETSVMNLEKDPGNPDFVNSAFRAVHTLKGGASSMGYNNLAKVAHSIEDLMDLVRSNKISLTPSVIEILFDGAKLLKEGLNFVLSSSDLDIKQVEKFSEKVSSFISSSTNMETTPTALKNPTTSGLDEIDLEELGVSIEVMNEIKEVISTGKKVYLLDISFRDDSPFKEVGILQVISILRDSAQIIDSNPSVEEIYLKFYPRVKFIVLSEEVSKIVSRVNISDIVSDIKVYEVLQKEKEVSDRTKDFKSSEVRSSILRVESSKVDDLMNIVGELVVNRSGINENVFYFEEIITDILNQYYELIKSVRTLHSQISISVKDLPEDLFNKFQVYVDNISDISESLMRINGKISDLKKRYDDLSMDIKLLNKISVEIQDRVSTLRMVPVKYLFSRLPVVVRELSLELGKDVDLVVKGEETNLDKSVVDELFDPVVHIIRNCIDHGIESREERVRKGKPPRGNIVIEAFNEGGNVIIRIKDDGRGIDFDKIKERGIKMGILKDGVEYDKEQLLSLIFMPGFSTKENVSSLSGRGVGMDIVKSKVEKLRGSLIVSTGKDKGTMFTIKIPLTISIMKVLLFEIKETIFAIPVNSIDEAITV